MPLISPPQYTARGLLKNGHINTIYPALFRKVQGPAYQRERLELPDGDFLDLDWALANSGKKLVLVLHGLEASSQAPYVRAMVKHFNQAGWDAVALNFRGCSGSPNRLLRSYHSGDTADVHQVLLHITSKQPYEDIVLVGFSLGGNVLLKYLGEQGNATLGPVRGGIAISAPVDIYNSCETLSKAYNWVYVKRFMLYLNQKLRQKQGQFPGEFSLPKKRLPRNFQEFDGWFTAPIHGFASAEDYWRKASSLSYLSQIQLPTLVLNPLDDPFLGTACYPLSVAKTHPKLFLETPAHGGHVGMVQPGPYGAEIRALEFAQTIC